MAIHAPITMTLPNAARIRKARAMVSHDPTPPKAEMGKNRVVDVKRGRVEVKDPHPPRLAALDMFNALAQTGVHAHHERNARTLLVERGKAKVVRTVATHPGGPALAAPQLMAALRMMKYVTST